MSYNYTTIDGQRVEVTVAEAYNKLKRAFENAFPGLTLVVSSGTRTREEQAALYHGWINRLPGYSLAAAPGYSNHEETGPRGPRALDLRDTGADAGVTVAGSTRSQWLRANAAAYGFDPAGFRFGVVEPWHYEYTGPLGVVGGAPQFPLPKGWYFGPRYPLTNQRSVSGYHGNREHLRVWQARMKDRGWSIVADGLYGEQTSRIARLFQMDKGLYVDGLIGVQTWDAAWSTPIT